MIATVKDLKCSVDDLKRKLSNQENDEIKELLDKQKVMDQVINANTDAIKRIDREIKSIIDSKAEAGVTKNASDNVTENDVDKVKNKRTTKCRYFNSGYCKYCDKCRFIHPENICTEYLNTNKWEKKGCADRHPTKFKWEETDGGCRRKLPSCYYRKGCTYIGYSN